MPGNRAVNSSPIFNRPEPRRPTVMTHYATLLLGIGAVAFGLGDGGMACAQGVGTGADRFELAETVQLDRVESTTLAQLERAKAYLADRQWDEAVEIYRRLMAEADGRLIAVTPQRYIGLRDYVHLQLAALPPEALTLYRRRVDPVAGQWYREAVAAGDRDMLRRVVDEAFASRFGDDALLALGEMALESGDHTAAREYWQRLIPILPKADTSPMWPHFPDAEIDLAAVRARLVLVSILEGSRARAEEELAQFTRLHETARGMFGGREVDYATALRQLLADSTTWPEPPAEPGWPTFAGSPLRNKTAEPLADVGKVAWRVALRSGGPDDVDEADDPAPLSFHPAWVDDLVLVGGAEQIHAVRPTTGEPPWEGAGRTIYRPQIDAETSDQKTESFTAGPAYTLSVVDRKVYARLGGWAEDDLDDGSPAAGAGYLVALDLHAEGRLIWKVAPEEGWTFSGTPVCDGASVFVGMQRRDVRPQAYVACFDARSGRRLWRRFVCGAETPPLRSAASMPGGLLTLKRETLYYNTNLGAVAALSARDGRLLWLSLYPRASGGNRLSPAPHWCRGPNPCVYDCGMLLVAPADSPRIFAFDASTGGRLWQTGTELADATDLLGVAGDWLIAGGGRLYWVGLNGEDRGQVKHVWPESHERPGYGRGLLSGDDVLWPTRERLYVFDQQTAALRNVFDLKAHGTEGGNLLVVDGRLLIATGRELIGLSPFAGLPAGKNDDELAGMKTALPNHR